MLLLLLKEVLDLLRCKLRHQFFYVRRIFYRCCLLVLRWLMSSGLARAPTSLLHMIHHLIVLLLLVLLILKDEATDADVRARLRELLLLGGPLLFLNLKLLSLSKGSMEDLLGQLE